MNLLQHLEELANNATPADQDPTQDDIDRWCRLFHYSASEAEAYITGFRTDLDRRRLSDEHWNLIKAEMEADGYNRETYEYELQSSPMKTTRLASGPSIDDDMDTWIFKFGGGDGPFDDIESLQRFVGISAKLEKGCGEEGDSDFAVVDSRAKRVIQAWLRKSSTSWSPTFVRLAKARKDLANDSSYPTLGVESSLPQHRAHDSNQIFRPAQNEYPVWYFFYGTLQDAETLRNCLEISGLPEMIPACIKGGVVRSWQGKYKALVDGPAIAQVDGYAYRVESIKHEDLLRFRESENYEVVRCRIDLNGEDELSGLTFRFAKPHKLDTV
ncbi:MAG: hypothetical protein Q9169_004366 [Polycauliona sp. 2 TL-2023]